MILAHGRSVARLASAIAKKMKYCDKGIKQIHLAALVHDIGKIKIPAEIINKKGRFTPGELAIIKKHPELGYQLLGDMKSESIIAEIVLQHHERMDGSGYPFGLKGKEIIPASRIVTVADVIAAIVSVQPYRPALTVNDALKEIKQNSGLLYDSEVVAVSIRLIEKEGFTI